MYITAPRRDPRGGLLQAAGGGREDQHVVRCKRRVTILDHPDLQAAGPQSGQSRLKAPTRPHTPQARREPCMLAWTLERRDICGNATGGHKCLALGLATQRHKRHLTCAGASGFGPNPSCANMAIADLKLARSFEQHSQCGAVWAHKCLGGQKAHMVGRCNREASRRASRTLPPALARTAQINLGRMPNNETTNHCPLKLLRADRMLEIPHLACVRHDTQDDDRGSAKPSAEHNKSDLLLSVGVT